ncbi:MAG: hypothetical protein A3F09_00065 [Chlamydiae bacterium RIFCSPHIGHO2_12_FULL_49_11]|nr:MAG: hypothetical protein A3F09_00065 [Chlamydiae bacterium RIFCSPHIGHO2_12_FULL_49_11]
MEGGERQEKQFASGIISVFDLIRGTDSSWFDPFLRSLKKEEKELYLMAMQTCPSRDDTLTHLLLSVIHKRCLDGYVPLRKDFFRETPLFFFLEEGGAPIEPVLRFLGLFDLAAAGSKIVDGKLLRHLLESLTEEERRFLEKISKRGNYFTVKIAPSLLSGSVSLEKILIEHGFVRIRSILHKHHPDLGFYLRHVMHAKWAYLFDLRIDLPLMEKYADSIEKQIELAKSEVLCTYSH